MTTLRDKTREHFKTAIANEREPRAKNRIKKMRHRLFNGKMTTTEAVISCLDLMLRVKAKA